ncbi:thrombospondin type 1 domain protein [Dictyocaulus viviparus]|uniref:Thrombospondin type 1 domain protein n=1 Tax=Dictyocaulus viviparus TaxID=29172 RepID=A0A0D8XSS3_DICVI|nr:thrombospondin type 1 domain protein [Dictyocaulus viviparus]
MLERFLDNNRGQIQCLFDQPVQRKYYEQLFEDDPPGRKYDVSQQCRFVFGPQSELCPYMPTCRRLWCATYYGSQMGCRTQHMPWADGTPCDKTGHMQCLSGECVSIGSEHRAKVDGGWGEWRMWETCSRTCGGGIQRALRDCDNPKPANGGKYCVGQRERYRSCNVADCPWDTPGFREIQCAEFNNKDVGIHGIPTRTTWIPKYASVADNERCKLYCRVAGSAAFYLLKEKVVDGTPCDRNGDDICVDGTCIKAGCDHRLYSTMTRDKCGICGGDGTTCRTVKGTYNERGSFGYNAVMKIPAGSANIDIRQHGYNNQKDDDNYLSIRAANGEFLLNGHYQVSVFRQQIPIQDVILEYSGSDNIVERINGTGPISGLKILLAGNALSLPLLHLLTRGGDHLSCEDDMLITIGYTPSLLCSVLERIQRIILEMLSIYIIDVPFNIACLIRLARCSSKPASETKLRIDIYVHVLSVGNLLPPNITYEYMTAIERKAAHRIQFLGVLQVATIIGDLESSGAPVTEFVKRNFSGSQTQELLCFDLFNNRQVNERMCNAKRPQINTRMCNINCFTKWLTEDTTRCSVQCGSGEKMQRVYCVRIEGDYVVLKSQHSILVVLRRESHALWIVQDEGGATCSQSCGSTGVSRRSVTCVDDHNRVVPFHLCIGETKEAAQKECNRFPCPRWVYGHWSENLRKDFAQDSGSTNLLIG